MAGGRDLKPRAPRWFDWLICSSGLTTVACFIWRVLFSEDDIAYFTLTPGGLATRLLSVAVLPVLLLVAMVEKAARKLAE